MRNALIAIALVLACSAGAARAQAPVADFFSTTSTLNGDPIPAGTIIEAFDVDGIRCGYAEANAAGSFLIHVYGNDPMTPSIDEGAREGEMLSWKMNGRDVSIADTIWISNLIGMFADARWENGAAKEIRLDLRITKVTIQNWSDIKQIYGR
jgi:hypothetical protein